MLSNLSNHVKDPLIDYPILDSQLAFSDYILRTKSIIKARRNDLEDNNNPDLVIDSNCPFEFFPRDPVYSGNKLKYGALLIHGLLDCPFSLRDIGTTLQANGIVTRGLLLPGHGTHPKDLLNISYHDWIQATRYGVETLRKEVDKIYLVGYSTGAALSIYQALQDQHICGIILIAPAIKIKKPVDIAVAWHYIMKPFTNNRKWVSRVKEDDYAKYLSIPYNALVQVSKLTRVINELYQHRRIPCPIFMIMSHEDETVSSLKAIQFFSSIDNPGSKLLLYTSHDANYDDPRIFTRNASYPEMRIKNFSHISIPFKPDNPHYGQQGDYEYASRINTDQFIYGAYNNFEEDSYDFLHKIGFTKFKRRALTYNPDFNYMADKIVKFICVDS